MRSVALEQEQAPPERASQDARYLRRGLGWLLPLWAVACGAIASNGLDIRAGGEWLRLATLALLISAGWARLWRALGWTDWATPLRAWRHWQSERRVSSLPYTQPGSLAERGTRTLGQIRTWWQACLLPSSRSALASALGAILTTAVLALLLGPELVLVSVACFALIELAVAWERGRGQPASGWHAGIMALMPWLAGHVAFSPLSLGSVLTACSLALGIASLGAFSQGIGRVLMATAAASSASILILARHPLAACAVLVLHALPYLSLPWGRSHTASAWQWEYGLPFLLVAGVAAAWAL